jgi:hypothetical protein
MKQSMEAAKLAGFADRLKEASVEDRGAVGSRRSGSLPSGGTSHSERRVAFLHSPAGFSDHMKALEGDSTRSLNSAFQNISNKIKADALHRADSTSLRRAGGAGKAGLIAAGGVAAGIAGKHLYDKHKEKHKEASIAGGLGSLGSRVIGAGTRVAKAVGQGENYGKLMRTGAHMSGGGKALAKNVGIGTIGAGLAAAGAGGALLGRAS